MAPGSVEREKDQEDPKDQKDEKDQGGGKALWFPADPTPGTASVQRVLLVPFVLQVLFLYRRGFARSCSPMQAAPYPAPRAPRPSAA